MRAFGHPVMIPGAAPQVESRAWTAGRSIWMALGAFLVAASGALLAKKTLGSDLLIVAVVLLPTLGAAFWSAWRAPPAGWDGMRRSLLTTWIIAAGFVLSLPVGIDAAAASDSVRENPGIAVVLVVAYGLLASVFTGALGFVVGHVRVRRLLRTQAAPPSSPDFRSRVRGGR